MSTSDALAWAGLVVGLVGFGVTAVQTVRLNQVRRRRVESLLHVINRVNFIKLDHEIVQDLLDRYPDQLMARHLWQVVQASVELYMRTVDESLSEQDKVTYADLDSLVNTPLMSREWQYRYWVSQVSWRKENRGRPVPEVPPIVPMARVERYFSLRGDGAPPERFTGI